MAYAEPSSFKEALAGPDSENWQRAVDREIKAHEENETWTVVRIPKDSNLITSRWVFKRKTLSDGSLDRYKARLVARGFDQKYGQEYHETFAPVARHETIRLMFALATNVALKHLQFDVETAFLHGKLEETVYMAPPSGMKCSEGHALRLNKSLYGLKQAPRVWKESLDSILRKIGLEAATSDPCLYLGKILDENIMLIMYVDDGLAFSTSGDALQHLFDKLSKALKMRKVTDSTFVGYEFEKHDQFTILHQESYIRRMIKAFHMEECLDAPSPMVDTAALQTKSDEDKPSEAPYRQLTADSKI